MEDDIIPEKSVKHTYGILTKPPVHDIIIKMGYVCKGGGSAFGGKWKPKKENDKRFLGEPNSTRENLVTTTKGSYKVRDKYNDKGLATRERHLTDHTRPDLHTDPHDHTIDWSKGFPDFSSPINYWDGDVPEFKTIRNGGIRMEKNANTYSYENRFETLEEFKFYLSCGANIGFEFHGTEYGIEGHNNSFDIWISYQGDIANGLTLEQTLDYEFDGVKLRDFITTDEVEITERIM